VRYRILGSLQVVHGETVVDIGPPKQRVVLAALLLGAGRVVSVDRLIESVWEKDAPAGATANVQVYVSNLRRALRGAGASVASPIVRQPPGYFLDVGSDDLDVTVFTRHCVAAAKAVEDCRWQEALDAADEALSLWRGPFLDDVGDEPWVLADAARADELRRNCRDSRITALLALGRVGPALTEASILREADPLSDRGCWLQMVALFRGGRAPEALDTYSRHAKLLDDELGMEPGTELRDLQLAVLRQAPELAAWPRPPTWSGAPEVATPAPAPAPEEPVRMSPLRGVLVGRTRELALVEGVLTDLSNDAVRWLVLAGPPGIGKTRFAEEVAAKVTAKVDDTVWVGCPDERATPAWWTIRHIVRALGAEPDDVLDVTREADADTARFLVYERVERLLEALQDPRVIVIDDVQWADPASAGCLAYLAGCLRNRPLVVVVTLRDGVHSPDIAKLLATVARGERNRHISLSPLSTADVAVLARAVADDAVSDAEASALAERTGGNPFFVSEYARLPSVERRRREIPSGIKAVLGRREAGVGASVLNILRTAAVVADVIDTEAITLLSKLTGADLDALSDSLDSAADERLIVGSYTGDGYVFAHGLLREHLISGIPAIRRQRLHAEIAELLIGSDIDGAQTRRAQHLIAAQPLVQSATVVAACRMAAEQAAQQWSSDVAAQWWRAALDAYDRQPASARDDVERDELVISMLDAYARAGRGQLVLDAVQDYLREALRAGRAGTVGRLAGALLRTSGSWPWLAVAQDPGELLILLERAAGLADTDRVAGARVLAALAVGRSYDPDPGVATGLLDRATELAADSEAEADVLIGKLTAYVGQAAASQEVVQCAERLMSLTHSRSRENSVIAHAVASVAALNLADVAGSEAHVRAAIDASEELQLPLLRAQARWMEANLAVWRGDFPSAERHLQIAARIYEHTEQYRAGVGRGAALHLLRERGAPLTVPPDIEGSNWGPGLAELVHTVLLTLQDGPEAENDTRKHLAQWRDQDADTPEVWYTLGRLTLLSHLAADHDLSEFAAPLLEKLAPFEDRIALLGQAGLAGPVALAMARLHAALGDRDRARPLFAKAQCVTRRNGGKPWALRCALFECELEESPASRRRRARDIVDAAEELGLQGVARRASALL
jgi:DNA-binding SARP family transcriptional activator